MSTLTLAKAFADFTDVFTPEEEDDWRDQALCAQTDPESFFPEKGGTSKEAKKVCQACEVRAECLQEALDNNERFGIWGGLSERERRKIAKGQMPHPVFPAAVPPTVTPEPAPGEEPTVDPVVDPAAEHGAEGAAA